MLSLFIGLGVGLIAGFFAGMWFVSWAEWHYEQESHQDRA